MPDLLIRDVPENVISAIEFRAAALGLSRPEYLRRRLTQDAARTSIEVSVADLHAFCATVEDLGNDEVMAAAWR